MRACEEMQNGVANDAYGDRVMQRLAVWISTLGMCYCDSVSESTCTNESVLDDRMELAGLLAREEDEEDANDMTDATDETDTTAEPEFCVLVIR